MPEIPITERQIAAQNKMETTLQDILENGKIITTRGRVLEEPTRHLFVEESMLFVPQNIRESLYYWYEGKKLKMGIAGLQQNDQFGGKLLTALTGLYVNLYSQEKINTRGKSLRNQTANMMIKIANEYGLGHL